MDINTYLKSKEYITSRKEMNRRKIAFASLEISLFLSICIFSLDSIISWPEILVPITIISAIILILLSVFFNWILDRQACLRIYLSDNKLERKFISSNEIYSLTNLKSIRIKRNTRGLIREIRFRMTESKDIFINGLEDFEEFKDDLINISKNVQIDNFREPIDFDHPLYYPILGTMIGIISSFLFRLMLFINKNTIKYVRFSFACFIIFFGVYWALIKPVSKRYGNKHIISDYICAAALLTAGILIIIDSKLFW